MTMGHRGLASTVVLAASFAPACLATADPSQNSGVPVAAQPAATGTATANPAPALVAQTPTLSFVDPGFESFALHRSPQGGWYSDDARDPGDGRAAELRLIPDETEKIEGRFSLRLEQGRTRPAGEGHAFICQRIALASAHEPPRRFEISMSLRGQMSQPLIIDVYVWDANRAHSIARKDSVIPTKTWTPTTVNFDVPDGYDAFGLWVYLPREANVSLWIDHVRLKVADAAGALRQ